MSEFDKIIQYEDLYRQGRQAKDLWKYIPKKLEDAVDDTAIDSDGYWIYLAHWDGWTCYDGGEENIMIHCYTIKDLIEDIKTIRKEN